MLKHQDRGVRPHYFMANRGGQVEAVTGFLFLGWKITADGDCSHEIRRQCAEKQRHQQRSV